MKREKIPALATLGAVAFLAAAAWWLEVHLRGWDGLRWVGYFHIALPVGVALFIAWLNWHCRVTPPGKRVGYLVAVVAFATLAYQVVNWSLRWHFGGYAIWAPFEDWPLTYKLSLFSIFAVFPALPIAFLAVSRLFGIRFTPAGLIAGLLAYGLAIPVAIFVIYITGHRGAPDVIHTIKTGFCIPLLMLGLGLPLVFQKREEIQQENA